MSDKLTPKQNKFCQEYVIDYNGTRAAIRSGYSEMTATEQSSQLLTKLNVRERISELEEQTAKELSIEKADVYRMLLDTLYLARVERNLGVMAKCTELIGKMIGSFVDRVENKTETELTITPESAELLSKIAQRYDGQRDN